MKCQYKLMRFWKRIKPYIIEKDAQKFSTQEKIVSSFQLICSIILAIAIIYYILYQLTPTAISRIDFVVSAFSLSGLVLVAATIFNKNNERAGQELFEIGKQYIYSSLLLIFFFSFSVINVINKELFNLVILDFQVVPTFQTAFLIVGVGYFSIASVNLVMLLRKLGIKFQMLKNK